jgi:outer membrane protein OmpA-like peptidoglycan-associated protein
MLRDKRFFRKKMVSGVLLLSTFSLLLGGCGEKEASTASGSATGSADQTAQAGNNAGSKASADDAFYNEDNYQNRGFDFTPTIKKYVKDEDFLGNFVGINLGYVLSDNKDLEADTDISATLESGEITDEFALTSDDGQLFVRVINVCADPVVLTDCIICSLRITPDSGSFALAKDMTCGIRTYDEIYNFYSDHNLYLQGDDVLTYKVNDSYFAMSPHASATTGELSSVVFAETSEVDGIFKFENGILSSINLEAPELLYYELYRNVSQYELEQMNAQELAEIEARRKQLLDELKTAFAEASVDVSIDEKNGTISMNSDILFDTDSYEVKDSAKEYMDSFFKVYTAFLMRDDVKSSIKQVRFEGHTDTQGDFDYNLELSINRAKSVLDYCVNASSLDDNEKSVLSSIAQAIGHSYRYPVFDDNGEVDMSASRRVEVNFIIATEYVSEDSAPADSGSDSSATASTTARGVSANPVYRDVDEADYSDRSEILYPGSPVLLTGDSTLLTPSTVSGYDRTACIYSSSDESVGEVTYEDNSVARRFFYNAKAPGASKVEITSPNGAQDGSDVYQFFKIRSFDENAGGELSLLPSKDTVVITEDNKNENVKFTLTGDYSGEVWAFVYYTDPEQFMGYEDAEWIDPTTLSIDVTGSIYDPGDHCLVVILTPKGDLDTMLGCLRYNFTVE